MNKIRLISWLACLLLPFGYLRAQETHWNCNIADYEFDMTMYLNLQIDGQVVTNHNGYEVAAFCGEECRGIASVESVDGVADVAYYYLRVRSNQAKGENIVIKVYEKETGKEFTIDENIEFVSQSVTGYPSAPKNMEYKNTYKIVFVVDGNVLVEQSLLWGSIVAAPQIPAKEGHTFSGWSEVPETMPAQDITVIGSFTVNTYTIIYMVDGTEYKKVGLEYGATITVEAEPTKDGYTFSGWSEIPATMPAQDVTVTGLFTANTYTVTYILEGETFQTLDVVYGTAIPTPEVPAKEGYNFSGWGELPATMPAQDLTFSGSYTINKDMKYNLVYMVDGVEYKREVILFGDPISLVTEPTKEGHTFSGWSEVPETMPLHDVTVTGTFTANSYILIYILEGETYKTETVVFGTVLTAPEVPTKEGYTFSGWSEVPATMPAQDVTITGNYSINSYTLLYIVNGIEYKKVELEYGATITTEAEPTKEGYTFSGWSEVPATMPANDVTVTGSFAVNKYEIVYNIEGETFKKDSVLYGATIVTPEAPAKEGHTFAGWGEVPATMPANDLVLNGTYTVNKYNLIYTVDGTEYKKVELEYGASITAEAAPEKEGHTFSGWSEVPATMPAQDVTVEGSFTVNKYEIVYNIEGEVFKKDSVLYGATIVTPEAPAKEGHTFAGWGEVPATMPANDLALNGTYTVNKYNLIYTVDGTEYKKVELEYGASITAEAAPEKEGHTFSGWSEVPATMPAQDVTVEGSFTVNKYEIVYNIEGEVFKKDSVLYGATIVTPEAPAKEGHTFAGWGEVPATMPANDLALNGTYTVNKYNLIYTVDGTEYKKVELEYGASITAEAAPEKEGHTFSGWSEIPETMPANDVTVTGSFAVNTYTITYMVDGTEYKKVELEYGATITAEAEPTKEGHTFSGWSEVPATMPANDVTVTGSFAVNTYTITYMVDGAEYKKVELEYGATITAEAEPTKEGYTFSGWSEVPETMPANDVTVTGSFAVNTYTITYMVDGEVYATEEVVYGEVIVLKEAPTKEGYIFSGWSEVPETMPAYDIEVRGEFANSIRFITSNRYVDVYTLQGVMVKQQLPVEELETELPRGIYIIEGKKVVVRK